MKLEKATVFPFESTPKMNQCFLLTSDSLPLVEIFKADLNRTDKTSFLRKDLNCAFGLFGASE